MSRRLVVAALAAAVVPVGVLAQFEGVESTGKVAQPVARALAPPQAANAPQAPWSNPYGYGGWEWRTPYRHTDNWDYEHVRQRYNWVDDSLYRLAVMYPYTSQARRQIDHQREVGRELWRRYRRYMYGDTRMQLEWWLAQQESWLASYGWGQHAGGGGRWGVHGQWGWGSGGVSVGIDYGYGYDPYAYQRNRTFGSGCDPYTGACHFTGYNYPDYGYYDTYSRLYHGSYVSVPDPYFHALTLGDGIHHIIRGANTRNDLELWGGALTTFGSILNIAGDNRRYRY